MRRSKTSAVSLRSLDTASDDIVASQLSKASTSSLTKPEPLFRGGQEEVSRRIAAKKQGEIQTLYGRCLLEKNFSLALKVYVHNSRYFNREVMQSFKMAKLPRALPHIPQFLYDVVKNNESWCLRAFGKFDRFINKKLFNLRDEKGFTIVHWAVVHKNYDLILFLSRENQIIKPDFNAVSKGTGTPLFYAIKKGDARMVEILVRAGADPNFDRVEYLAEKKYIRGVSKLSKELIQHFLSKDKEFDQDVLHNIFWEKVVDKAGPRSIEKFFDLYEDFDEKFKEGVIQRFDSICKDIAAYKSKKSHLRTPLSYAWHLYENGKIGKDVLEVLGHRFLTWQERISTIFSRDIIDEITR